MIASKMKESVTKERFVELRAAGHSYTKISEELRVTKQTLINWSKELNKEISNLSAIEREAIFQKHFVAKERRIEAFGKQLEKILIELEKRDPSSIPTEKLLTLALKYGSALKTEEIPLQFTKEGSFELIESFHPDVSWSG